MSKQNDIYYFKLAHVVVAMSRKHRFVRLTILKGFPIKAGMIRPLVTVGRVTLAKQDLMSGREWTLYVQ